jgi:PST family polysaccharide transporter
LELIRTSLLTAFSTAIKLVSAFAINKVVAVVAGPAGMALIGQVQSVAAILQGVSSGLFSTAAVKYSAEWKDQPERLRGFLSLSYTLVFWITLAVGSGTAGVSAWLAAALLNDSSYWWVFTLLALTIPFFAVNSLMLSVINGLGDVRKLTLLNVGQSTFGLTISIGLPLAFGVPGALAATVLASAVVFALIVPELKRHDWLRLRRVRISEDHENLKRLCLFGLMAVTSSICGPLSQLIVREWIVERCSVQEAGYWQGLMRFSGAYLMFFTTTLAVYFLPKFSSLGPAKIKRELIQGYILLLPIVSCLFFAIWLARGFLVPLLFSREFAHIEPLLGYQLVGDFLKIGSWMISFLMLARAKTTLFVVSEILFNGLYVLSSMILIGTDGSGGARGAVIAWIGLYATYWIFLILSLPKLMRCDNSVTPLKKVTCDD